jgi:hypothetical protein
MFFDKTEKKSIDGVSYEISNGTSHEIWNCKQTLFEIYNQVDPSNFDVTINADSYVQWKKDFIKLLKEFDKMYTKHIKSGYVEMNHIHQSAMRPLLDLMSSNFNLNALELLEKKG